MLKRVQHGGFAPYFFGGGGLGLLLRPWSQRLAEHKQVQSDGVRNRVKGDCSATFRATAFDDDFAGIATQENKPHAPRLPTLRLHQNSGDTILIRLPAPHSQPAHLQRSY